MSINNQQTPHDHFKRPPTSTKHELLRKCFSDRYLTAGSLTSMIALVCLLILIANPARASLNDELNGAFNDMINVTPGGSYDTQRRGVISGGSISMCNKVVHPNLISWVPPEIKGGCGGIDLFAGSFSFINATEFTQLSRNIAQAAVGYAFELAIEGMCPTCAQVISKLQSEVQKMNSLLRNSCEAATWAVNKTGLKAWRDKEVHDHSQVNTGYGFVDDYFKGKEGDEPPAKVAIANGKENEITGNIVYQSIQTANASSWFAHGDDDLKMTLMSLTGTLITNKKPDDSDVQYEVRPPLIKTKDILEGGEITIYKCESAQCLLPEGSNKQTKTIIGLRERTRTMLEGTGSGPTGTGGLLRKIRNRKGGDGFTLDEQKFIDATSPGAYGLVRRASTEPATAALIGEHMTNILAVELANSIIDDMYTVIRSSVVATGKSLDSAMLDIMRDNQADIEKERTNAGQAIAGVTQLLALQDAVLKTMRTPMNHKTH